MIECSDCGQRRSIQPDNALWKTGGYECPKCSERFEPVAKYEKVDIDSKMYHKIIANTKALSVVNIIKI